jgi:hypothetical protein
MFNPDPMGQVYQPPALTTLSFPSSSPQKSRHSERSEGSLHFVFAFAVALIVAF